MTESTAILMKIAGDVGETKGIVMSMDKKLDRHIEDDADKHSTQDTRIQKLEQASAVSRAKLGLLVAFVGAVGGGIVQIVQLIMEHK